MTEEITELKNALEKSQHEQSAEVEQRSVVEAQLRNSLSELELKVSSLTALCDQLRREKEEAEAARSRLEEGLLLLRAKNLEISNGCEKKIVEDALNMKHNMLSVIATECQKTIQVALDLFNDPKHESGNILSFCLLYKQNCF